MNSNIKFNEKVDFISWFLKNYRFKRRECVWMLNYLISNKKNLDKVVFSTDVKYCKNSFVISSDSVDGKSFVYYKDGKESFDAEEAFKDLSNSENEVFYIELLFPERNSCYQYQSVVEENPFIPDELKNKYYQLNKQISESLLSGLSLKFEKDYLCSKIDIALDNRNYKDFMRLTEKLNELTK